MITLDNKMELFSKVVLEKIKKEYNTTMKEIDKRHLIVREEKMQDLGNESQIYVRDMQSRAIEERKKIISKSKGQARKNILIKREELFIKLNELLVDKVKLFCSSEEYEPLLSKKINEILSDIVVLDGELIILCRENDSLMIEKILKNSGIDNPLKIVFDEHILGGFTMIHRLKGIKINLSLNSIIEENNVYIGSLIYELLEEAGDKSE